MIRWLTSLLPYSPESTMSRWTLKACFSGPQCWCRIIVDPDGVERNAPADMSRTTCRFIVNALNRTPGHETRTYPGHPTPWAVASWDHGRRFGIVDANDKGDDALETCVSSAGSGLTEEEARIFVNAVNNFYVGG